MARIKKVSALIRRILDADPKTRLEYSPERGELAAWFTSINAMEDVLYEVDGLEILQKSSFMNCSNQKRYLVTWDCSEIGHKDTGPVTGFSFDKVSEAKVIRKRVNEQEDAGADLIGGRRHVGSGAIEGLKSDASSDVWQQEAKQTVAKSIGLSLEWLEKIQHEAKQTGKRPMLFVRFAKPPSHMVVDEDWVVIQASVFERMRQIEETSEDAG
jgi:hypothetical protein